jgi:hypothetical protein
MRERIFKDYTGFIAAIRPNNNAEESPVTCACQILCEDKDEFKALSRSSRGITELETIPGLVLVREISAPSLAEQSRGIALSCAGRIFNLRCCCY